MTHLDKPCLSDKPAWPNKDCDALCYLYQEYEVCILIEFAQLIHHGCIHLVFFFCDTPEHACRQASTRNSPRIVAFIGEETKQYFVLVEQDVLCQVPSVQLTLQCILHLEYPKQLKNVMYFLQDCVLAYPDCLQIT